MAISAVLSSNLQFPTTEEIKVAMETAGTSIEGAEYLQTKITQIADSIKAINKSPELRAKADNVLAAVGKFTEYVLFKLTASAQPWSGEEVESSELKNMLKNMAEAALKTMDDTSALIKFDYALSDQGHLLRGYSSNNAPLDEQSKATMDKLLNAWLATKDYVIQDGYLFHADDKVRSEGSRVASDIVQQLFADNSLEQYMTNKGVANFSTQTRDYPGEQKEARAQQILESALEQANKSNEQDKSMPDVQQPSSSF